MPQAPFIIEQNAANFPAPSSRTRLQRKDINRRREGRLTVFYATLCSSRNKWSKLTGSAAEKDASIFGVDETWLTKSDHVGDGKTELLKLSQEREHRTTWGNHLLRRKQSF